MNTDSLFVKGKGPILTEYLRTRKKLGGAVAGRGFSFEPGFMYDAQNELEIDVKSQLSALNYQLLEQAIAQELKQSGLDYDLAFKNAMIAWESDKQALISAWDQELALAKKAMSDDEELLNILAIEVGKRAIGLMEAKTAIELEMEGYRKTLEELDGTTGEYEVQLAEAKIVTARKRLEVIPYLEQLIAIERLIVGKEQELVVKEQEIAESATQIIAKETEILNKTLEIIEKLQAIAEKDQVISEKNTQIVAKNEIIVDAMDGIIEKKWEAVGLDTDIISAQESINSVSLTISEVSGEIVSQETSIISLDANVLAQEKLNVQQGLEMTTQEANRILAQSVLISEQAIAASREIEIAAKDAEIIEKNAELVMKEELISGALSQAVGIDTQIISKTDEIATVNFTESGILSQVADEDARIADAKSDVIAKEQALTSKYITLSQLEMSIAGKETLIANKIGEIVTAIDGVGGLLSKQSELITEKGLITEAITGSDGLISKQQEVSAKKTEMLIPAIESLIDTMALYVAELDVQQGIYDEIAVIKGTTATTELEKVGKIEELFLKKQSLFDALGTTLTLTQNLISFKETSLAPAISDLISVLNEYGGPISGGGAGSLLGGGSSGGALEQQILLKKAISDVRKSIELLAKDKVDGELDVDQAEVEYENAKNSLSLAELNLETVRVNNEIAQTSAGVSNQIAYATQWGNTTREIITEKDNTTNTVIQYATDEQTQKQTTDLTAKQTLADASLAAIETRTNADVSYHERLAEIEIESQNVTAALTHLLKQD